MDFLIGFVSNIIATTMCQPIDVLKTKYQTNPQSTVYSNIKSIISTKSLFRGLGPNLGTYPIFWAAFFQSKNIMSNYIETNNKLNNFLISYLSGNIASLVSNPLFVIKVRMQLSQMSYIETVKNVYKKNNNIVGFYNGFPATAINNLKLGIQFPLYNMFYNYTNNIALSSFLSKGLVSSIMYPMDLVRVTQRSEQGCGMSVWSILKKIHKKNGIRGLYRGILLYNCVSVPQFMIMMYVVEFLKYIHL